MNNDYSGIKPSCKIFDSWSISTDKSLNEFKVVEQLLQNLGIKRSALASTGRNDPPDCVFVTEGVQVGVEVVNLIDSNARAISAESRRAGTAEVYAEWTKGCFQKHVEKLARKKDEKIRTGISNKSAAKKCDKFWLVISTDEMTLYSAAVVEFVADWKISSDVFECVYLILSYDPSLSDLDCNGYLYFQLN